MTITCGHCKVGFHNQCSTPFCDCRKQSHKRQDAVPA